MTQRSLFTPDRPAPTTPVVKESLTTDAPAAAWPLRPDVYRAIESKYGPMRRTRGGVVVAEYRIVELKNGLIYEEERDGTRTLSKLTAKIIDDSIAAELWTEVKG
jgi:hypothetical protein